MGRFRILSMLVFSSVPHSAISDRSASPTLTVVWHFWMTRDRLSIPYQPLLAEEVCCMIDWTSIPYLTLARARFPVIPSHSRHNKGCPPQYSAVERSYSMLVGFLF
ncbi:hypothetical protein F5141DRAFT_1113247 [Pisolithus sp. B1]|nr:hypothetical protein F5141DRAFT_1113247 [Pisolithus sp. B1]